MADLITAEQVGARMRRTFTGSWLAQVEATCEDVSGLVREIADGELDDATSATVPVAVRRVCFEMVRRAVNNPNALTEEGADSTYRWKVAEGNDTVYATTEEQEIILDAVGKGGLGSIDMEGYMPPRLYVEDTLFLDSL